jgi:DNA polymerase zeta
MGGWVHEEEYRMLVEELVRQEKVVSRPVNFDTFVKHVDGEQRIRTAIESVEDLYPSNLQLLIQDETALDADKSAPRDEHSCNVPEEVSEEESGVPMPILGDDEPDEMDTEDHSDTDYQLSMDPLSALEASMLNTGEIGESNDDVRDEASDSTVAPKRLNDSEIDEHPSKRQRLLAVPEGKTKRHVSFDDGIPSGTADNSSASQDAAADELPRISQSIQASIKAQGTGKPSTLSFPVVKNPHAPDTVLRLSQSAYSNSQEECRTPKKKEVSSQVVSGTPTMPWSNQKPFSIPTSNHRIDPDADVATLVDHLGEGFRHAPRTFYFGMLPPTHELVQNTMIQAGLPPVIYQDAYYSNELDVPDRPREYAGREFKLQSTTLPFLPEFDPSGTSLANFGENPPILVNKKKEDVLNRLRSRRCTLRNWELAMAPPSFHEVADWLQTSSKPDVETVSKAKLPYMPKPLPKELSQIEGPTQKNKHGFKYSQKQQNTSVTHETQYMSILSVEVHVNSRGSLVPDPKEDEIQAIFWCIQGEEDGQEGRPRAGIVCLSEEGGIAERIAKQVPVEVEYEDYELGLINRVVDIVRQFDPDILTGYEVHNGSWGYLIERAGVKYEYDLCDEISRMKSQSHGRFGKDADRWGFTHTSTIRVTGRHMINIWRAMRGELNLLQYTMENVVFHLLHKRIPHYSHADLTTWYRSTRPRDLSKVLNYFLSRVIMNLEILEVNEIIPRTSEQARLLGVDFFSVISRGSQFKVESTMFRIAKPENFILVSPSRKQVGQQNALECLPLVMEPQSDFYTSPVLVLDFQSLYPSVMIAYNYCYSTCLGRIVNWRGRNKMGFMGFKREAHLLELVKDHINIAPNGMMYVKPEMRKSLLAKMLGELLETRVMVKSGMKMDKDDKALQQLLNNRQLALKLLANVTYGYTSASFSGRMPCSEIADSIVQTGRETLEKAIALIHSVERWGAEVVYGDTDSLFIHLKGRTRDQAFDIGEEIAEAVTKANPRPVKLKFEKVYHPCVLLAKKRYVGFKYESRTQKEPEFDAKGIETVRRDGTPAEQKIEEKALKILFRTSDLSQVKAYFQSQCTKIMSGRISIQDFLFAKEVKLGTYSERGQPPPGALLATKRMLADPRAEPQYGERVPYVVVTGAPGARLIDRCVAPETLLQNDHMELDAEYYISKNLIPPLERIFNLVGANVRQWYDEMPKVQRIRNIVIPFTKQDAGNGSALLGGAGPAAPTSKKSTLESYMKSSSCLVCRAKLSPPQRLPGERALNVLPLCSSCLVRPARALLALKDRLWKAEQCAKQIDSVCRSCAGLAWGEEIKCDSRDCPVFYTRVRERERLAGLREGVGKVIEALEEEDDGDVGTVVQAGDESLGRPNMDELEW